MDQGTKAVAEANAEISVNGGVGADGDVGADPAKTPRANDRSTRKRTLPELKTACRRVDDRPEFAGRLRETLEERILLKLDIYDQWLEDNELYPPRAHIGNVHMDRVLATIGHAGAKVTLAIKDRIARIGEADGFKDVAHRHDPEQPIDVAIDEYAIRMRDREKGPPRRADRPSTLSKAGIAEDMRCDRSELDGIAMARLRRLAKRLEPGDLVFDDESTPTEKKGRVRNPAVDMLLAKELARRAEPDEHGKPLGLVADPGDPGLVDMLVLARDAGVAAGDLLDFPDRRERVEEARRAVGLVPNPALAERRYTYATLIEFGEERRLAKPGDTDDAAGAVRKTTFALRGFMRQPGVGASHDDLVPLDFAAQVAKVVAGRPSDLGTGFRSQMKRWTDWNAEKRASMPLPADFTLALRVLAHEAGVTASTIGKELGSFRTIWAWFVRGIIPSIQSDELLRRVEAKLGVADDTLRNLLKEERRTRKFDLSELGLEKGMSRFLPADFGSAKWSAKDRAEMIDRVERENLMQDTDFARRQSDMTRDEYLLKEPQWPEAMKMAWAAVVPEEEKKPLFRKPGDEYQSAKPKPTGRKGREPKEEWRSGTVRFYEKLMASMFGYWTRARVLPPEAIETTQRRKTDFRPQAGLGIRMEHLHPILFAFPDLISAFNWWRSERSGGAVRTLRSTTKVALDFLRPEKGIVWKSPGMLEDMKRFKTWWDEEPHDSADGPIKLDIQPFIDDWRTGVERAFERVASDYRTMLKGDMPETRDPFLPVRVFVDDDLPMAKYMIAVRNLLDSAPYSMNEVHVHRRDCILALVLVQTALRAGTLLLNLSGPEQTLFKVEHEDGRVEWKIRIPGAKFKNFDSPYFKSGAPYEHTLIDEDDLYDRIEEYLSKSRPYLLAGRSSHAFFVTSTHTDFDERALNRVWRRVTSVYFVWNEHTNPGGVKKAVSHGTHAVRAVVATHIVRTTGDLNLAAWAIQDQAKTLEKHYADFIPRDRVQLAQKVLIAARAVGRPQPQTDAELPMAA